MKDFHNTSVIFAPNLDVMQRLFLVLFCVLVSHISNAQTVIKDSCLRLPIVHVNYGYHFPAKDLAERFGDNSTLGVGFLYKTRSNILIGADFSYIFGTQVHNKDSVLKGISTSSGYVIDGNGLLAEVHMFERGFHSSARLGYMFPFLRSNPNSGPFVLLSGGLLQHHIRIENPMNVAPQIVGDYSKGYDKLSNGFAFSQMLGYMYLGDNRLTNFYVGLEFLQAWTMSRRDWDFQLKGKDTAKRIDIMNGIKIGWVLPIYKRSTDKFYYF